jgi:hypothetical protein
MPPASAGESVRCVCPRVDEPCRIAGCPRTPPKLQLAGPSVARPRLHRAARPRRARRRRSRSRAALSLPGLEVPRRGSAVSQSSAVLLAMPWRAPRRGPGARPAELREHPACAARAPALLLQIGSSRCPSLPAPRLPPHHASSATRRGWPRFRRARRLYRRAVLRRPRTTERMRFARWVRPPAQRKPPRCAARTARPAR